MIATKTPGRLAWVAAVILSTVPTAVPASWAADPTRDISGLTVDRAVPVRPQVGRPRSAAFRLPVDGGRTDGSAPGGITWPTRSRGLLPGSDQTSGLSRTEDPETHGVECVPSEPTRVDMPADVVPHWSRFPAGEHHFDITGSEDAQRHYGDHVITHGHHNYDISADPAFQGWVDHDARRSKGLGRQHLEKTTLADRHITDYETVQDEPWLWRGMKSRGWSGKKNDYGPRDPRPPKSRNGPVASPRPSWHVIYEKPPRRTAFW